MPTPINCPNCQQPFNALLEQLIDVGKDPESKRRLLDGRINQINCPHCGFKTIAATPVFYHDHSKELAISYVPVELGLNQVEQERFIGDMTNSVMRSLSEEDSKGYLLQPKASLSMQGLIDQVLEADGITKEVIQEQQRKVDLVNEMAEASPEEQDRLIAENTDAIDEVFFELMNVVASAASQQGQSRQALRLFNLRSKLMDSTEVGQALKVREEAMAEASRDLQALGERITRESFVNLLLESAGNQPKVQALGVLAANLLDYTTFQTITERANAAEGEERDRIVAVRETLLEISAALEQQRRAVVEQAAQVLSAIMGAPDVKQAVQQHAAQIDNTFMSVLQANLEEARRTGNVAASGKLREVRDEVLALVQEAAPPEVRFINELLSIPEEEAAIQALHERQADLSDEVIALMHDLSRQLREIGNDDSAARLDVLAAEAVKVVQA